ncbi:MAG: DUF1573 domain-containing protein [Fimbriimonadaceae bacterium]|nr:DUF1573 domain-containing protein [Fimbriimonadaceae bacterium]
MGWGSSATTLLSVKELAVGLGLEMELERITVSEATASQLPVIVHLLHDGGNGHFAILTGFGSGYVQLWDGPGVSVQVMATGSFSTLFSGFVARPRVAAAHGPSVVLEPAVVDVGVVAAGQDVDCTVRVRNVGRANARVSVLRTSCGCTMASLSAQSIVGGGEAVLKVRVSPPDGGEFSQIVELATDAAGKRLCFVTVRGEARVRQVVALPGRLRLSGVQGAVLGAMLVVVVPAGSVIVDAEATCSVVEALVVGRSEHRGISRVFLNVTAASDQLASGRCELLLRFRDGPIGPLKVPVDYEVRSAWRPQPSGIVLPEVQVGSRKEVVVVLERNDGQQRGLSAVRSTVRDTAVSVIGDGRGSAIRLSVVISPSRAGLYSGVIEVIGAAGLVEVSIPVTALAVDG